MNANRKPNRKILSCFAAVLFVFLGAGCQKNAAPTYEGHPSSPYITALAKGEYYLEMSMFYNGTIIENRHRKYSAVVKRNDHRKRACRKGRKA